MTTTKATPDSERDSRRCTDCGMTAWGCNRLQDIVYEDDVAKRREAAVEVRKDTTDFIAHHYVSKTEYAEQMDILLAALAAKRPLRLVKCWTCRKETLLPEFVVYCSKPCEDRGDWEADNWRQE